MPKYYCDYCDTYLTHDSPSVRKTHCTGRKHKDNVKFYYQKWMEEQAQHLIDATTAAYKAGKIAPNPFTTGPPKPNISIPPPTMNMPPRPGGLIPGMPAGAPPLLMGPNGPLPPPMMGMRPPPMMVPTMGMPPMGLGMRPPVMSTAPPQLNPKS
ncbi:U1 small nuclear ribonucleoprotein C [Anopheles maculipalpis]|uniref:U1 small nuclear ribonucleoprotein C n=2 Tax=Neocellia TaxID=44535 RepID=A0A182YAM9_ANOST|nr:U1 small nuclear ribonucleoprotein C [Anopheles stephensi]XP_035918421.1 U1 small nuclear ribonucleoprotein C [Anopheles stephensi]XP_050071410.1 U1 small nuclear ribonucleoprotein C [Anopheles maculipalpis]